jgi:Tfp pilus assembly protein FimT
MQKSEAGVTLVEMLIVFVLIGIITAISLPKLANSTDVLAVRSARQEIASYISQARAVSIQTGRVARFVRNGNVIQLMVTSTTGVTTLFASQNLGSGNGVTLAASPSDTISFDPRGVLLSGASTSSPKIRVSRNGVQDSVCVVGWGKVSISQCQLAQ